MCLGKKKTPKYAQVSVTKLSSTTLSQREESSMLPWTSENMAHTCNHKLASYMEKVEIIYMGSVTTRFMASEVQEPKDISRLHCFPQDNFNEYVL